MKEVPKGWVRVRMQDLASINPPKIKPDLEDRTPLVFVPMPKVAEDFRGIDVSGRRPLSSIKRGYTQFRPGDVLFAKITPCMENGKIAIVPEIRPPLGYGSTEFFVMRSRTDGIGRWIAYCVARSSFRQLARESMQGAVGQRRVPRVWLENASVPLAPLSEQHRIVARIESLFARLDEGLAALKRAQANLERYRASVLKAAVEGNLTERWRRENPPCETGEDLLQRILAERRRRWETEQLAKFEAKGRKPPKNWRNRYKELAEPDVTGLPELPEGWCWAAVGQVFDVYVGATPKRSNGTYWGGDIRWVSSGEVAFHDVWETRERITARGLSSCSAKLHPPGTVMLAMIGEGRTRGQTAVLQESASHNQNSAAIRVSEAGHEPRWVFHYLRARYELTRANSSGNNQPALSKRRVEAIPIPVPPVLEQAAIVRRIEGLLSTLDPMLDGITRCTGLGLLLRQSILKRGFEGRLVPQDPADEPASVLLGRIRAQRRVRS